MIASWRAEASSPEPSPQVYGRISEEGNADLTSPRHLFSYTGFPKKDARYPKLKNIPDLLSDEKEGKLMENNDFSYLRYRASFMGNPVYQLCEHVKKYSP